MQSYIVVAAVIASLLLSGAQSTPVTVSMTTSELQTSDSSTGSARQLPGVIDIALNETVVIDLNVQFPSLTSFTALGLANTSVVIGADAGLSVVKLEVVSVGGCIIISEDPVAIVNMTDKQLHEDDDPHWKWMDRAEVRFQGISLLSGTCPAGSRTAQLKLTVVGVSLARRSTRRDGFISAWAFSSAASPMKLVSLPLSQPTLVANTKMPFDLVRPGLEVTMER